MSILAQGRQLKSRTNRPQLTHKTAHHTQTGIMVFFVSRLGVKFDLWYGKLPDFAIKVQDHLIIWRLSIEQEVVRVDNDALSKAELPVPICKREKVNTGVDHDH